MDKKPTYHRKGASGMENLRRGEAEEYLKRAEKGLTFGNVTGTTRQVLAQARAGRKALSEADRRAKNK